MPLVEIPINTANHLSLKLIVHTAAHFGNAPLTRVLATLIRLLLIASYLNTSNELVALLVEVILVLPPYTTA